MWQILGNLYKKDKEISKDYLEIKEIIRKGLLKEPQELSIVSSNEKERRSLIKIIQDKGFKDCNLHTVLKAIGEIQQEEHKSSSQPFNINIDDIVISIDTLPF